MDEMLIFNCTCALVCMSVCVSVCVFGSPGSWKGVWLFCLMAMWIVFPFISCKESFLVVTEIKSFSYISFRKGEVVYKNKP